MKKHTSMLLIVVLNAGVFISCKKDNKTKDKSVAGKTWFGQVTYTYQSPEYYCIHFNDDHSLIWSQFSGDSTGRWLQEGRSLKINFTGNSNEIRAEISDNDTLMNVSDNSTNFQINSGKLVADPNMSIDNTLWKSIIYDKSSGISLAMQMSFKPDSKVEIKVGSIQGLFTYVRYATGGVIRVKYPTMNIFGIVVSDREIDGSYYGAFDSYEMTRQ
jgi:hypothetical protein